MSTTSRRDFLRHSTAGAVMGMAGAHLLGALPAVADEDTKLDGELVSYRPEIEPLVRLLEETPRGELLEKVARDIKGGRSYREVVAALQLASVRNVQPKPSVGFKFHAVLVVNSAHLASISGPASDRWLPIFWALDYFKDSQADEARQSGWRQAPLDEKGIPNSQAARAAFEQAVETWDEEPAEHAIAGLVRTAGHGEVSELLFRYGMRDFRSIGHKAIFVANALRLLDNIGWRYAEPILRSISVALVNRRGDPAPHKNDLAADRPWRRNQELVEQIPAGWQNGKLSDEATRAMLDALRNGSTDDACDKAVELLQKGVSAQSIWDAVYLASGELVMRQPAIVPLHAITTTNAARAAFDASGNETTRRLLLLQNCAFVVMFRDAAKGRGRLADRTLESIEPVASKETSQADVLADIFDDLGADKLRAAGKLRSFLKDHNTPHTAIDAARRLVFLKGRNAHDYKYSSAVLEDAYKVSPNWRDLYLASTLFLLHSSRDRTSSLVARTRSALEA